MSGITTAYLKGFGTVPEVNDLFTISVIQGARTSIQSFTSQVGMGSEAHCLFGDDFTSFVTSSMQAG